MFSLEYCVPLIAQPQQEVDCCVRLLFNPTGCEITFPTPTLSPTIPPPSLYLSHIQWNEMICEGNSGLHESGCHGFGSSRCFSYCSSFSNADPKASSASGSSSSSLPPLPDSSSSDMCPSSDSIDKGLSCVPGS